MRNLDFCHKFFSSSRHLGGPSLSSGRENVTCLCLFLCWRCLFSAFGPCDLAQTLRSSALLFSLPCPSSFEIRRSPRTSIHHSTSVLCVWTASTCLRPSVLVRAPVRASRIVAAFHDAWNDIPLDLYVDYVHSMPHRIAAIIKANGDATKY